MHLWLLSPYHTGSHQAWAEGYARHSRHRVTLLTLPGQFWKWRMLGAAVELAAQAQALLAAGPPPDRILATDMLDLPTWLGLLRLVLPADTPTALYMHENQLTYPLQPGARRDPTYALINWRSQLAADGVIFNSRYHRRAWFRALPKLLKHFPDYTHLAQIESVRHRSHVLPVGLSLSPPGPLTPSQPPLILWNQRWEYDKRPDRFFALLDRLQDAGLDFRVAVAGENVRQAPDVFLAARARLGERIVHWGYLPSRESYLNLLARADLVISTADHEFFGISVLEAIAAGAFPLLPRRLSYPELIPPTLHAACLYHDEDELFAKAVQRLTLPRRAPPSLRDHVRAVYDWAAVAPRYDTLLEEPDDRQTGSTRPD
jgi:glycosyltransferase involved in cell wall biosynthesis